MEDIKIYDKHVAFWGSFLSNFYPCTFILNEPFDVIYEINDVDESAIDNLIDSMDDNEEDDGMEDF